MVATELYLTNFEAVFKPYEAKFGHFKSLFTFDPPETAQEVYIIAAQELFEPANFREVLTSWGNKLPTPNLKVAASLWGKHYISLLVYRTLGLLTVGGLGLDSSLSNLSLVLTRQEGEGRQDGVGSPVGVIWRDLSQTLVYPERSRLVLAEPATQDMRQAATLDELYEFTLVNLFQNNFAPVWEQIHAATNISRKALWGNLGVATNSVYNFLTNNLQPTLAAIAEDNQFINGPANAYIHAGPNPLYRQIIHKFLAGADFPEPIRERQTCCLWYKIPQMQKCITCPLLKPAEQLERWQLHFSRHHQNKSA